MRCVRQLPMGSGTGVDKDATCCCSLASTWGLCKWQEAEVTIKGAGTFEFNTAWSWLAGVLENGAGHWSTLHGPRFVLGVDLVLDLDTEALSLG
jgi:hypothetical protein